jgi:hypothetical protein
MNSPLPRRARGRGLGRAKARVKSERPDAGEKATLGDRANVSNGSAGSSGIRVNSCPFVVSHCMSPSERGV